jgi:hypothetical protein
MPDMPPNRDSNRTPRWAKVFGIVALVVVVVFVILLVIRGPHTPARHFGSQMTEFRHG